MSSNAIINAAPMTIMRGIQDLSTRTLLVEPEVLPTHLPKVYIYAQKGPTLPQLVVGNSRNQMYGDDTFDIRKPYATHQTVLSNIVNAQGNAQMIERVLPPDVGPKANLLLSLDVLETDLVVYQREVVNPNDSFTNDGQLKLDADGQPIPVVPAATVKGYKTKWVVTTNPGTNPLLPFGGALVTTGNQTGTLKDDLGVPQPSVSKRYPVLELEASSEGSVFNNSGIRLSAPDLTNSMNEYLYTSVKAYPFRIQAVRKPTDTSSAIAAYTLYGETFFDFVFKPKQINPNTDAKVSLEDIFLDKYQNLSDIRFPLQYGDFGRIKVYTDNIDLVLANFTESEVLRSTYPNDFNAFKLTTAFIDSTDKRKTIVETNEHWKFNFVSAKGSNGVPYDTVQMNYSDADALILNELTNIFASGGYDGTMFESAPPNPSKAYTNLITQIKNSKSKWDTTAGLPFSFAELVEAKMDGYADQNSIYQDTAVYAESIIYDSGFPLKTKYALCKFISERKDTAVVLSTYDVNGQAMSASEEHAIALALRTRLQMYPESDYYGTNVVRGMIVGRYGDLRNNQYTKKLPATIEIADKAARMMGAGDGKWKTEMLFDRAPNSEITMFDNINVTFTPANVRNKDWEVGLNWIQSFSRKNLFFPALKTVYDNDTSVLNSFFTMMACVELEKVGERVWRQFSGSVALTNGQLVDRVNASVQLQTIGRFAGMYKIVPEAYMSDADLMRGYSYTLPIKIYANSMKSVLTLSLHAYRMTDYPANTK